MAFITCDFYSESLGVSTSMCVILPQNTYTQIGMNGSEKKDKYPTLYLLHGLSDDHTIWHRRTSIERYVSDLGIAVVMPNGGRSFYTDMKHGYKYFTFITEELPQIASQFFPLSTDRKDNFIAGLSMGGYGAFKIALSCPDKFSAAASLSGVLDISSRAKKAMNDEVFYAEELKNIFGDINQLNNTEHDLFYLAKNLHDSDKPKPRLYQCCGTEDFLYNDNLRFRDFIKDLNFDYTYEEEPGDHQWCYWDKKIVNVLNWLKDTGKVE